MLEHSKWYREGVSIGMEKMDIEQAHHFEETKEELERTKVELATAREELSQLQQRLSLKSDSDEAPVQRPDLLVDVE